MVFLLRYRYRGSFHPPVDTRDMSDSDSEEEDDEGGGGGEDELEGEETH
eukprot:COSAG06_NODE_70289_length_193_cov_13.510638_1_plen_48_part_10